MTLDLRLAPRGRSRLAGAALTLAGFSICVTLYATLLLRSHAVAAAPGFAAFVSGLALAALAILVGFAAMAAVWRSGRRGGVRALFAVFLATGVLAGPLYAAFGHGLRPARLDDVSTDLADPPRLERAAGERKPGDLAAPPVVIPAEQAARQRAAYPDLAPLLLALPPDDVAGLAIGLVESRGWRILGPTSFPRGGPPTGRIEAVAASPILGLQSDVAIRVRPEGDGARVDMRSAGRIGGVDFGGEAARIKSFLADLAAAANALP